MLPLALHHDRQRRRLGLVIPSSIYFHRFSVFLLDLRFLEPNHSFLSFFLYISDSVQTPLLLSPTKDNSESSWARELRDSVKTQDTDTSRTSPCTTKSTTLQLLDRIVHRSIDHDYHPFFLPEPNTPSLGHPATAYTKFANHNCTIQPRLEPT